MRQPLIKNLIYLTIAFFCHSCDAEKKKNNEANRKEIVISDVLKLSIPDYWIVEKDTAVDSDLIKLFFGKNTHHYLIIESGYGCNSISEKCIELVNDSSYYEVLKKLPDFDPEKIILTKSNCRDIDFFKRQNVNFDSIGGRTYKLISPVRRGHGITGVHFYKVSETDGIGDLRINIYGHDLNESESLEFYELIKRIKWVADCENCNVDC